MPSVLLSLLLSPLCCQVEFATGPAAKSTQSAAKSAAKSAVKSAAKSCGPSLMG